MKRQVIYISDKQANKQINQPPQSANCFHGKDLKSRKVFMIEKIPYTRRKVWAENGSNLWKSPRIEEPNEILGKRNGGDEGKSQPWHLEGCMFSTRRHCLLKIEKPFTALHAICALCWPLCDWIQEWSSWKNYINKSFLIQFYRRWSSMFWRAMNGLAWLRSMVSILQNSASKIELDVEWIQWVVCSNSL